MPDILEMTFNNILPGFIDLPSTVFRLYEFITL